MITLMIISLHTRTFKKSLEALKEENFDDIIPLCTEVANSSEFNTLLYKMEILLLRSTFYLLLGKHELAIQDLNTIINSDETSKNVKVNALIKRATLYMQIENSEMTFNDFELAVKTNPSYGDIYHHRGQVLYHRNRNSTVRYTYTDNNCFFLNVG